MFVSEDIDLCFNGGELCQMVHEEEEEEDIREVGGVLLRFKFHYFSTIENFDETHSSSFISCLAADL